MKRNKEELTIKDILDVFAPKLWLILVVAIALSAVFGLYSALFVKDTYTSTSTMYVYRTSSTTTSADLLAAEDMVEVYRVILMSDDLLNKIVNKVHSEYKDYDVSVGFLRSSISFASLGRGMFNISVTTIDADLSLVLSRYVHDLATAEMLSIPNALMIETIQEPKIPTGPNDKNGVVKSAIGFLAGAIVTMIVIWIFHALDVVIHDKKRIEDNFDIPVLGVIPIQAVEESVEGEA